jgi:hypothetical protein
MFEVSLDEFYAFTVRFTVATNGLMATQFKDTTTFEEVHELCVQNWGLTPYQSQELSKAMANAYLAKTRPSVGAVARAMGYLALVD